MTPVAPAWAAWMLWGRPTTTHELDRRVHLFLRQAEVEQHRWYEVVRDAGIEPDESPEKRKNVDPDFNTVKNLFGDAETGRQMYLTCRNLSRYVHPTATTFKLQRLVSLSRWRRAPAEPRRHRFVAGQKA